MATMTTMALIVPATADTRLNVLAESDPQRPIVVGAGPTEITLSLSRDGAGRQGSLGTRLRGIPATQEVYLQLKNLRAEVEPGITYNIYVNLPARSSAGTTDPHYVGTVNTQGPRDPTINVTERLKQLNAGSMLDERTTVTVVPAGRPATGAEVKIDRVLLLAE